MDYLSALYYGIIQGLTEFLPVSSSGHLALLPHFLKINDPGVLFDLAMHIGTALSITVYFWKDVKVLLAETIKLASLKKEDSPERNYTINMMIATLATFILAFILKKVALTHGRAPNLIAFNLFLFGILMFVADFLCKHDNEKRMDTLQVKTALAIGIFQALAIFPGVSRSGSTLTISRFMNLTREEATRFSFLLSLPVIIAGFVFKFPEFWQGNRNFDLEICLFGAAISFFVGIITIHFFLKVIKKMGLAPFSLYRVILAAVIYSVVIA